MASCLARRLGKDILRAPVSGGWFRVRVLVFRDVAAMDGHCPKTASKAPDPNLPLGLLHSIILLDRSYFVTDPVTK